MSITKSTGAVSARDPITGVKAQVKSFYGEQRLLVESLLNEASLIEITTPTDEEVVNTFGEVSSVASGSLTTIVSYTVPSGKNFFLQHVEAGGTNIARYDVIIDGITAAKRRNFFGGEFSLDFEFGKAFSKGLKVAGTKVISIKVIHTRPSTGDFEARILGILKG